MSFRKATDKAIKADKAVQQAVKHAKFLAQTLSKSHI